MAGFRGFWVIKCITYIAIYGLLILYYKHESGLTRSKPNADVDMKIKDVVSNLGDMGQSPLLNVDIKATANSAYWLIDALATELALSRGLEPQPFLAAIKERTQPAAVDPSLGERYQALLHFVEQVAPVLDQAASCEMAGAEQMQALYRTLSLSTPAEVHPNAGLNVYLYSGRCYGADDDDAAVIYAADDDQAKIQFLENYLNIFESDEDEDEEESEDEEVRYYIITNKLIGVVNHLGHIVPKAK